MQQLRRALCSRVAGMMSYKPVRVCVPICPGPSYHRAIVPSYHQTRVTTVQLSTVPHILPLPSSCSYGLSAVGCTKQPRKHAHE